MLAPSPGFLKTEEPPDASQEAPDRQSQGEVWSPNPAAKTNPKPVMWGSARNGGKEGPMWRCDLIPA